MNLVIILAAVLLIVTVAVLQPHGIVAVMGILVLAGIVEVLAWVVPTPLFADLWDMFKRK